MKSKLRYALGIFAICIVLILAWPGVAQPEGKVPMANGSGGAVASVDVDASRIGIEVLRQGGNAVDAATEKLLANGERWEAEIARNLELDAPYR